MELAEDRPPSALTHEGGWSEGEAGGVELVGELQMRSAIAPAVTHKAPTRPWPLILAFITFGVDLIALTGAYILAKVMVGEDFQISSAHPVFATIAIWPVVFAIYGLYDLRRPTHATAELQRLFNAIAINVLLVVLFIFVTKSKSSVDFIPVLLVVSLVTVTAGRLLTRRLGHSLNAHAVTSQVTLIAGTNDEARALARTLQRRPWMGYRVCGFVEVTQSGLGVIDGLPVFGTVEDIAQISTERNVQSVIIAGSAAGGSTLQSIDSALSPEISVRVSPGLANLGAARIILEPIDGMALFSLRRHRFSRRQRLLKRTVDLGVTSVALVIATPVMLAIALAIKLTSPGPVLFKQRRVGAHEREFTILKFRTMVVGAHAQREALDNEADGLLFKMRRDPRVTPVGRFLRRYSLDELPNLWNVLRGEMSIVGPRPFITAESEPPSGWTARRFDLRPGITGLWQVSGRNELTAEELRQLDYLYVTSWALWWDIKICADTPRAMIRGLGAY